MYWLRLTLEPTSTPPTRPTMYWLHGKPPIPPKKQKLLLRLDTLHTIDTEDNYKFDFDGFCQAYHEYVQERKVKVGQEHLQNVDFDAFYCILDEHIGDQWE